MLIDDIDIKVTAGSGGKGAVAFNKNLMELGPSGARGGDGGSVFVQGVADLNALSFFQTKKNIKAPNGDDGRSQFRDGNKAEDLTLFVPVGTVISNLNNKKVVSIEKIGQRELIAQGGQGGHGNFYFRSSTDTSPTRFERGSKGQSFDFKLELKLIADVGLIGLPNVGKSSLLNELTRAKSKVANYQFTTLEPNLGVYFSLMLADIPGLIEGASQGKGLGFKFLKHIEHTKVLFHLVAADSAQPVKDYQTVIKELESYKEDIVDKPEYIFISKSDEVSEKDLENILKDFEKIGKKVTPISILDSDSLEEVKKILNTLMEEKKA